MYLSGLLHLSKSGPGSLIKAGIEFLASLLLLDSQSDGYRFSLSSVLNNEKGLCWACGAVWDTAVDTSWPHLPQTGRFGWQDHWCMQVNGVKGGNFKISTGTLLFNIGKLWIVREWNAFYLLWDTNKTTQYVCVRNRPKYKILFMPMLAFQSVSHLKRQYCLTCVVNNLRISHIESKWDFFALFFRI